MASYGAYSSRINPDQISLVSSFRPASLSFDPVNFSIVKNQVCIWTNMQKTAGLVNVPTSTAGALTPGTVPAPIEVVTGQTIHVCNAAGDMYNVIPIALAGGSATGVLLAAPGLTGKTDATGGTSEPLGMLSHRNVIWQIVLVNTTAVNTCTFAAGVGTNNAYVLTATATAGSVAIATWVPTLQKWVIK